MDTDEGLRQAAHELASNAERRTTALERDLFELERTAMAKRTALREALLAQARLGSFSAQVRGDYQCPRCWIEEGSRSPLRPIVGKDTKDSLRCGNCGSEFAASGSSLASPMTAELSDADRAVP